METIPLEMDDIFDENDDDVVPTRLPDLDDLDLEGNLQPMMDTRYDDNEQAEGGDEPLTDNPELLAKLKSLKGASKNVQKRTYIKLDATRLTGERGIPILPKVFKNVKLKGKHHEAEDLKTIMHHLEHWGHRLFPKMPFTEVLERIERLGAKKPVQTCVKRIRLGMPILPTDFEEDEQDVRREGDEVDETNEENTSAKNSSFSNQIPNDDEIEEFLSTAAELEREQMSQQSQNEVQTQSSQNNNTSLSEEAKARIERNKQLAMERRAARLAKVNSEQISSPLLSNPLPAVSGPNHSPSEMTDVNSEEQQSGQNDISEMSDDENVGSTNDLRLENERNMRVEENSSKDESKAMNLVFENDCDRGDNTLQDNVSEKNLDGSQNIQSFHKPDNDEEEMNDMGSGDNDKEMKNLEAVDDQDIDKGDANTEERQSLG